MSRSMYWRPVPKDVPPPNDLSSDLMFKLINRYGLETNAPPVELGPLCVSYLEGLADCGVPDADELVKAIREHESVHLWIEN